METDYISIHNDARKAVVHNTVKKRSNYGSISYDIFLKQHIHKLNWEYFTVTGNTEIFTVDGLAQLVKFTELSPDPNSIPIGVARINNELIFIWNNYCWRTADDDIDTKIIFDKVHRRKSDSVILYQIGNEPFL